LEDTFGSSLAKDTPHAAYKSLKADHFNREERKNKHKRTEDNRIETPKLHILIRTAMSTISILVFRQIDIYGSIGHRLAMRINHRSASRTRLFGSEGMGISP
jgi:hypothetical protein